MKKLIKQSCLIVLLVISSSSFAGSINSLSLVYDEVEESSGLQQMRYLINEQFLRIDGGVKNSDFILFNVKNRNVYSVNHEDRTILKIVYSEWKIPEFDFQVSTHEKLMKEAPQINNKPVYNYQLKAGEKVCTQVFFIKDMYPSELKVLHRYQQTLSSQQVATLDNTPVEFHTPCFLVDQVYQQADYYLQGLPVQITHSRGYARYLKHFEQLKVDEDLFVLPEGYHEYLPFSE